LSGVGYFPSLQPFHQQLLLIGIISSTWDSRKNISSVSLMSNYPPMGLIEIDYLLFFGVIRLNSLLMMNITVKRAPDGLVQGDIAKQLDIPSSNLSLHLKAIVHSGLVNVEREGRFMRYKVNIPLML
jgi:hypothetical protein